MLRRKGQRKTIKILVALPTHGTYGGMEIFALALAEWLQRHGEYTVRVCFKLVGGNSFAKDLEDQCKEMDISYVVRQKRSLGIFRDLLWCDLLHLNNLSIEFSLLARVIGRPIVATVHNWNIRAGSFQGWAWKLAHSLAAFRTYNSEFVRRTWVSGDDLTRDVCIPTVSRLTGSSVPAADRRGFFFISRWIENKGLDVLIEAYARARIDKDAWPLKIAGDGPIRDAIMDRIRCSNSNGISILGRISDELKLFEMGHAKWVVCVPNTREDLGLTPIEARHLGVPVIASVDGGVPESAGPSAIFVPPGDSVALSRALELAAQMSDADYLRRCEDTAQDLNYYLRPLSVYAEIYRGLAPA